MLLDFFSDYLTMSILIGECLVALIFVMPLPPGFRNVVLNKLNDLWDASEKVRYTVYTVGVISLILFVDSLGSLYNARFYSVHEYTDAQRNACFSGFSLFMLVFEYRVQSLLRHYMRKLQVAEAKTKTQ